jgi:hypothetical protein
MVVWHRAHLAHISFLVLLLVSVAVVVHWLCCRNDLRLVGRLRRGPRRTRKWIFADGHCGRRGLRYLSLHPHFLFVFFFLYLHRFRLSFPLLRPAMLVTVTRVTLVAIRVVPFLLVLLLLILMMIPRRLVFFMGPVMMTMVVVVVVVVVI